MWTRIVVVLRRRLLLLYQVLLLGAGLLLLPLLHLLLLMNHLTVGFSELLAWKCSAVGRRRVAAAGWLR